jgi:hypothetical protein
MGDPSSRLRLRTKPLLAGPNRGTCKAVLEKESASRLSLGVAMRSRTVVGLLAIGPLVLPVLGPVPASSHQLSVRTPSAVELSPCWTTDHGYPRIRGVSFSPSLVSVADGPARVEVSVLADDTGGPGPASGLRSVHVVAATDPWPVREVFADLRPGADGVWRGTFLVHPGLLGGFDLSAVRVVDRAGYWRELETAGLASLGIADGFVVRGPRDRQPPRLERLSLGTRQVDVRRHGGVVTARARVLDDLGVSAVWFRVTHAASGRDPVSTTLTRDTGTARRGVWRGAVTVPPGSRPGTWNVQVTVLDRLWNRTRLRGAELVALGLPGTIEVRSHRDSTPPNVSVVSVSPLPVDTRAGDAAVHVRVRVDDGAGTGVEKVKAELSIPFAEEDIGPYLDIAEGALHRVGSRTWEGDVVVSRCQPWAANQQAPSYPLHLSLQIKDRARNKRTTWPTRVTRLEAPDTIPPEMHVVGDPLPVTGSFVVHVDEPLVGVTAPAIRPYYRDPWYEPGETPYVAVTTSCFDVAGAPVSCELGPVRSMLVTPATSLVARTPYMLEMNPEHVLSALDPGGNPAQAAFFSTR